MTTLKLEIQKISSFIIQDKDMRTQDYLCIGTSLIENVFFTGAVLGWPSLQYVLLKENYFGELCREDKQNVSVAKNISHESSHLNEDEIIFCPSRDATLNLALTLAFSFQYITSYPAGIVLDKFGTWTYRTIASISICIAYVLLAISSTKTSWLVYLSVLFLSFGGLSIGISNIQTANLAGPFRGLVVSLQTGTFVSAAVVFLIVKKVHNLGVPLTPIFLTLAFLSLFTIARTFLLMPKRFIPSPLPQNGLKYGWMEWSCFKDPGVSDRDDEKDVDDLSVAAPLHKKASTASGKSAAVDKFEQRQKYESFRKSVKSVIFWTNLMTFSIGHMRQNFYIGSFVNWVETFDKENLKSFINAFNIFFMAGVIASPLCGVLFDVFVKYYKSRVHSIWVANVRASFCIMLVNSTVLTLVSVLVNVYQVLPSIVFIVLSQFFVYGGNWIFLSVTYPMKHYGKLLGLTQVSASVTSLISYGLFRLALEFDPNFFYVNIAMLVISVLTFLHLIVLYRRVF